MLTIRLSRVGKKKQPEYRVIVSEKTKDPWGDALEYLGHVNPRTNPPTVSLNVDRIKHWLSKGAQVSDTVKNIFIDQKILTDKKNKPRGIKNKPVEQPVVEKPAEKKEENTEAPAKQE